MTTTMTRDNILAALHRWVGQRPGLEFGNYGDVTAYRSELRSITKDCTEARRLLRYVERSSISADALVYAAQHSYSGRLTLTPTGDNGTGCSISYCTGQYWPTEYRRAVCAVAASAIWSYWRDECMPKPFTPPLCTGDWYPLRGADGLMRPVSAGNYLRTSGRREFGRGMASRWFS